MKGAARKFDLTLTGELSLDFTNTIDEQPQELLNSYADLNRWGQHTGIVNEQTARRLAREASHRPAVAKAALARALVLREMLFRIFSAIAQGGRPEPGDLNDLNQQLADTLSRLRITPDSEGYTWTWTTDGGELDLMSRHVVRAAGELLTSDGLKNLRECAGPGCGWLFVDTSRNHTRRWCAMDVCGNRAKARRHYEQMKSISRKS